MQAAAETDRIKCVPSSWCGRRDSNPRHPAWQAGILTRLNYYHMKHHHSTNLCRTQVNPFPQRTHGSYQDTPASPHSTLRHNEVRVPSASDRTGRKGWLDCSSTGLSSLLSSDGPQTPVLRMVHPQMLIHVGVEMLPVRSVWQPSSATGAQPLDSFQS